MTSNSSTSKDYQYQFLEDPPDDLKCLICGHVARNPVQHGEEGCGRIFCNECISKHKQTKSKCPNCQKAIVTFNDVRSNKNIQSLRVKCHNSPCPWTGELKLLTRHITACDFEMVSCPNECTQRVRKRPHDNKLNKEIVKVFRKDIKKHLEIDCKRRQQECPYCHETGEYEIITGFHKKWCTKVTMGCDNSGCTKTFLREKQEEHISICPYQRVPCKYKEFGCDTKPCRKDLQHHEKNAQIHLRVTMDTLLTVQKQSRQCSTECSLLQAQLNTTPKQSHRITFKMEKFSSYKSKTFVSQPFYSHPEGYKMIIKVSLAEAHVTVSVYLMKGDHDSQLKFPFKGIVMVAILNQQQDSNHIQLSESVTNDSWGNGKVINDDIRPISMIDKRIEAAQLKPTTDRQYLVNDTLIFKVSVEVPSFKPWLC